MSLGYVTVTSFLREHRNFFIVITSIYLPITFVSTSSSCCKPSSIKQVKTQMSSHNFMTLYGDDVTILC